MLFIAFAALALAQDPYVEGLQVGPTFGTTFNFLPCPTYCDLEIAVSSWRRTLASNGCIPNVSLALVYRHATSFEP